MKSLNAYNPADLLDPINLVNHDKFLLTLHEQAGVLGVLGKHGFQLRGDPEKHTQYVMRHSSLPTELSFQHPLLPKVFLTWVPVNEELMLVTGNHPDLAEDVERYDEGEILSWFDQNTHALISDLKDAASVNERFRETLAIKTLESFLPLQPDQLNLLEELVSSFSTPDDH